jgi:hypothetical protein
MARTSLDQRWLGTSDPFARLRKIEPLDPVADCREITQLSYADFGSIMIGQLVPSLTTTYAAPRMSRILVSAGELHQRSSSEPSPTTETSLT